MRSEYAESSSLTVRTVGPHAQGAREELKTQKNGEKQGVELRKSRVRPSPLAMVAQAIYGVRTENSGVFLRPDVIYGVSEQMASSLDINAPCRDRPKAICARRHQLIRHSFDFCLLRQSTNRESLTGTQGSSARSGTMLWQWAGMASVRAEPGGTLDYLLSGSSSRAWSAPTGAGPTNLYLGRTQALLLLRAVHSHETSLGAARSAVPLTDCHHHPERSPQ
jgi:hypothetical protein